MGRAACEKRLRSRLAKAAARKPCHRAQSEQAEAHHKERMSRRAHGAQYLAEKLIGILDQGPHQIAVSLRITAERCASLFKRFVEKRGGPIVERVRERGRRIDPFYAPPLKLQVAKKRRDDCRRVNCRADVVNESFAGQLG